MVFHLGVETQQFEDYIKHIAKTCLRDGASVIVDPVMADNGKLYTGFDMNFVKEMRGLVATADIVLPNITEACFLTDTEYKENYDKAYIEAIVAKLQAMGCKNIVFTGVSYAEGKTGVLVVENGVASYYEHDTQPNSCHGTGDVYASAFVGAYVRGKSAYEAAKIAADYTVECIKETAKDPGHWYGARFEPVLGKLIEMVNN